MKELHQCIASILKMWDYKLSDFSSLGKQIKVLMPILHQTWRTDPLSLACHGKSNFPQAGTTMELETCNLECLKPFFPPSISTLSISLVQNNFINKSFK